MTTPAATRPRTLARWLWPAAAVAPAVFLAWFIAHYAIDMPFWDEWVFADFFVKAAHHQVTFADLWQQYNESRKVFPRLVMMACVYLTHLDVRFLMYVSYTLACATVAAVALLAKRTHCFSWPLLAIASLILLSPVQYQNWLWGIQIVVFFPAFCLSWALVTGIPKDKKQGPGPFPAHQPPPGPKTGTGTVFSPSLRLILPAAFATIATYSYSNGMLTWPLLLPALFFHWPRPRRTLFTALWVLLAAIEIAAYFHGYAKPAWTPSLTAALHTPLEALKFFLAFQGQFFLESRDLFATLLSHFPAPVAALVPDYVYACILFGVVLLALYTALAIRALLRRDLLPRTLPWLMFGAYSIASGALTTAGRVGLGAGFAATPRYRTFGAYLPVSIVFLAAILLPDYLARHRENASSARRLRLLARAAAVALAALTLLLIPDALDRGHRFRTFELQGKAALAFVRVIDTPGIREKVADQYASLRPRAIALDDLGLLHPPLIRRPTLEPLAPPTDTAAAGQLEHLRQSDIQCVATGWAILPEGDRPADAVVLAYQQPDGAHPFAIITDFHPRPDVAAALGDPRLTACGFSCIFPATEIPPRAPVTAWSFNALTNRAHRLAGQFPIAPVTPAPTTR